jgi:hypothetical protein
MSPASSRRPRILIFWQQELYAAKQQSQDILRTTEVFDLILSVAKDKLEDKPAAPDAPQTNGVLESKAPLPIPHGQPTTELSISRDRSPDVHSSSHSTKSDRSNPPEKMLSLVGELARARKEVETNSARIQDLEDALRKEKLAREVAEDRATQLENASRLLRTAGNPSTLALSHFLSNPVLTAGTGPDTSLDDPKAAADSATQAAAELQHRMEAILQELASVKSDMHSYKLRAEAAELRASAAEQERDTDKKTLLETIRAIRAEEDYRLKRVAEQGSQTLDAETTDCAVQVTTPGDRRRASAPPGIMRADSGIAVARLSKEQTLLLRKQSGAPYASLLGVVVLGVGLMAVINNWQRGER